LRQNAAATNLTAAALTAATAADLDATTPASVEEIQSFLVNKVLLRIKLLEEENTALREELKRCQTTCI
jgi:hypothetical protein